MKLILEPGHPVDDFAIELFFQNHKNEDVVRLSFALAFNRFRVGVAEGVIDGFDYEIESGEEILSGRVTPDVLNVEACDVILQSQNMLVALCRAKAEALRKRLGSSL